MCRLVVTVCLIFGLSSQASATTLKDAIRHLLSTNPDVLAEAAGRSAAGHALRQSQGRLLPTLGLDGDIGSQKIDRPQGFAPGVNNQFRNRRQIGITARQVLFNGLERANAIYRSAARLDAAAWRLMESSEARALEGVEAYIDVRRHYDILAIARSNLNRHREILSAVRSRQEGGKATISDVDQVRERVAGAEAIVAEVRSSLLDTKAQYRRVIGLEPKRISAVAYPKGYALSRNAAIRAAARANPNVNVADADADAAFFEFKQSKGTFFPELALEGRNVYAQDVEGTPGRSNEVIGRLVLTWRLFEGAVRINRRRELADRWTEAMLRRDSRLREVAELIDRALADLQTGRARIKALQDQAAANGRVLRAYQEEYELGKRTLLDLLNQESIMFSTNFSLKSARAVHLFSSFQLMAATGRLLDALGVAPPEGVVADHRAQSQSRFGLFRINIEPLRKY